MKKYLKSLFIVIIMLCQNQTIQSQDFSVINTTFKGGSTGSTTNNARVLGYAKNTAPLGLYGGTTDVQLAATGHFRTEFYNNQWYLVDPEGYLYFGAGINSVAVSSTYPSIDLPGDLKNIGLNHLANWSEFQDINSGAEKMPYVFRELFLQGYKNESQTNKDLWSDGIIAIFDPGFITYADQTAQRVAVNKDDPYCIGVFSDNEMPIYSNDAFGDLLARFLAIGDKTNPNYIAANNWMIARKGVGYTIEADDDEAFHGYVSSTYYRIVHDAIEKYAPNMLYIGARIHGAGKFINSIYRDSAPYVDVFSINWYSGFEPDPSVLEMWTEESGKPFVISEFYAKGYDVGVANDQGAGYNVPTQTDRVGYYENFAIHLLESKGCLGYQWFRFQDDSSNKGIVNKDQEWYTELVNSFSKINKDIYKLREFLVLAKEQELENRLYVLEDSFIRGGDNSAINYNGTIMDIKQSASGNETFIRNAWLKFDIGDYNEISSAILHVSGNQSSGNSFDINVFEAEDSWTEESITWDNAPVQSNNLIGAFATTGDIDTAFKDLRIDVTSYVQNELLGDKIVSMNLIASEATTGTFKISDKENTGVTAAYLDIAGTTLGLQEEQKYGFIMYPNPLNENRRKLNFYSPHSIERISVFSMDGRLVNSISNINANKYILDFSNFKGSSIYFIQLVAANGFVNTKKLLLD